MIRKAVIGLVAMMICLSLWSCQPEQDALLETQNLTYGVGSVLPNAADFILNLPQNYEARFAEEYHFDRLGAYTLKILVKSPTGAEQEYEVGFSLVRDDQPPVIEGATDIVSYVGEGISYRSGVTVSDNCDGKITLTVDSSAVDPSQEGTYPVIYTATDAAGNTISKSVHVYVYRTAVSKEMLYDLLDPIIAERITSGMTAEQKAREIYEYVYYSIDYDAYSDKSDWVRAAYEGLQKGKGDCFTYFALSKAFFERLGIENMDIQRTEGIVDERHYWNFVNIGTESQPRWYHFDACRISGENDSLGQLMTDAQIDAFSIHRVDQNGVSNYFYAYDRTSYPKTEETMITRTDYD